jgi:hypothetical protein
MSREETQRAAKKRHRVGHDITQVHFCSHSKQEVEQYYDELSCTCTTIQVSANKKMEALSNPDMLDIEESQRKTGVRTPVLRQTRCWHMSSSGFPTSRETEQSSKAWVWQEGQENSCIPCFNSTLLQLYPASTLPCFNSTLLQLYPASTCKHILQSRR